MTEKKFKPTLALALDVVKEYGTTEIIGHIVYHNEVGEMLNPSSMGYAGDPGYELADLEMRAYVDTEHDKPWGFRTGFKPFFVELANAERMVKTLRRIEKGTESIRKERGYVAEGAYHEYLFRVAQSLGIKDYYVRNTEKGMRVSGDLYGKRDGTGVQSWIFDRLIEINPAADH